MTVNTMTSTIVTYLNTLEAVVNNNGEIKYYILTRDDINFDYIVDDNKELKVYSKIPLFNLKTDLTNTLISGGTSINGITDIDACYQEIKNWKINYPTCNTTAIVSDGIKGDIEVAGAGTNYIVRNGVINAVKLGGDITSFGKGLLTAASAAIQRTLLGLGSIATASASDYILTSTKAQPNGVASLDSSGKVPSAQLPTSSSISDTDDVPEGITNLYFTTARVNDKVDKIVGKGLSTEDYSTAEKSKLAGIATGATVNDTDANLKNRTNHTGTQLSSTISDFQTTVTANTDVTANTSARHTHSNKALLDTYTQTEANLADAVTKKHSHSNITDLNAVTGTNTGDETTSSIQTKRPLKTVNGSSLEGSGNIVISGGSGITYQEVLRTSFLKI